MPEMSVRVIVGEQRGDEGKGRFTDMLAHEADDVGRGQGGNNAGHTIVTDTGVELAVNSIPSGIANPGTMNVIGPGCLVNAVGLTEEMKRIEDKDFPVSPDNLMISSGAHLILPHYISMDQVRETGAGKQGSTQRGISPAAGAKYNRDTDQALRAEVINNDPDKLHETIARNLEAQKAYRAELGLPEMDPETAARDYVEKALLLAEFITDTVVYTHQRLRAGKTFLGEGAQAFLLDVDHGMWPYVTSSSTTAGGVLNGLGIPPGRYDTSVIGVSKLVQSHVGEGPFVTEVTDQTLYDDLHGDKTTIDAETGTVSGRERRLGFLDLAGIRRAQLVNGTTEMAVTKLDWVPRFGDTVKICISYTRKGRELKWAPDAAYKLEQSTPNYVELPTWKEDIQCVRKFEDLPSNAQDYIAFIENQTEVPITMIGVGPARDQVIDRRKTR